MSRSLSIFDFHGFIINRVSDTVLYDVQQRSNTRDLPPSQL